MSFDRHDYPTNDATASFSHASKTMIPYPCSADLAPEAASWFDAMLSRGQYSVSIGISTIVFDATVYTDSAFLDLFHSVHCRSITTTLDSPKTAKVYADS